MTTPLSIICFQSSKSQGDSARLVRGSMRTSTEKLAWLFQFFPLNPMDAFSFVERIVLDVFFVTAAALLLVLVVFPGWICGERKHLRLEQCPKCGKWSKG